MLRARQRRFDTWLRVTLLSVLLGACASLPPNENRAESFAYRDTENSTLGRLTEADTAGRPGESGFFLLPRGLDAYAARAGMEL